MSGVLVVAISLVFLALGYVFYGRFVARRLGVDPGRPTPAHERRDGVDYVPARAPVVLGHHFASIAGAAPIVGPILAIKYGWLPVLLWVLLGVVFVGGVHDFASLMASVRHRGRSIGEVLESYVGPGGKYLMLIFVWATLLLVVAVFVDIVAETFVASPPVATASVFFILLAILFGLAVYRFEVPLALASVIGLAGVVACVWAGFNFPLKLSYDAWVAALVAYIFAASVAPVWVLLQPRDYLSSFLLWALLGGIVVGVFFYNPTFNVPAVGALFGAGVGEPAFPFLFVIVACGAISGFHALVASGTTAKQLNNERDAKPVAYGGMLIEGLLAVATVVAVGLLAATEREGTPVSIFAAGAGRLLTALPALRLGPEAAGVFCALAVSAFCLTSLDTATRLARFAWQEMFDVKARPERFRPVKNRITATAVAVAGGAFLAFYGADAVWPIFGAANQMLAALALLAVAAWLAARGRRRLFVLVPMALMFVITLSALGIKIYEYVFVELNLVLLIISAALMALSAVLAGLSAKAVFGRSPPAARPAE
ncbi:MAG: carbon starvation protein A [candidate division Zixibacteria bacterium]|nr:carbon starvation protein A [candidate division Zixibacteria bacterium]